MVVLTAREVGVRGPGATVAAAFVLALSSFRLQVGSGYVELTLALTMGATLAFTLRYLRTGRPGALVVACAAMGLACAVKIIALPIAAIVLVTVAGRALTRRQITPLAASVLLFVALGAPWYAYNVIDTGAPLSPASVKVLGMPIGFSNDAFRHISRLPRPKAYTWDAEWDAFSTMFGSFASAREIAGWPVLVAFVVFAATLPSLLRRKPLQGLVLLAIFVANVAVIYSHKFTPWRLLAPENATRFWVAAILVALPVSTLAFRTAFVGPIYRLFLLAVTLFNLVRLATSGTAPYELDDMMIVIATVMCAVLVYRQLARRVGPRARAAIVAGGVFVGLTALATHRAEHREEAFKKAFFIHSLHRSWADPAKTVDDGPSHRIAVTHGLTEWVDTGMFYFLLGSKLQNRLLAVSPMADGTHPFDVWGQRDAGSYERWVQRLEAARVEYVMSAHPGTLELSWMETHPERFQRVHGNKGSWGFYKLLPGPP
jgi:hypothetical protein